MVPYTHSFLHNNNSQHYISYTVKTNNRLKNELETQAVISTCIPTPATHIITL